MRIHRTLLLCLLGTALAAVAQAPAPAPQTPRPAPIISPEAHADRRVTFRLRAPNAKEVFLAREGAQRVALQKDETGVWSVTTEPLEPDYYGYSFLVDGVYIADPANYVIKPSLTGISSMVHVPGPASLPWELNDVPHGVIHRHFYHSGMVGDDRDFYVYTPPGYESAANKLYPVLYLLHGLTDDSSAWIAIARANVILDNLIAQGKAKPMVVVMPLGYGAPEILVRGPFSRNPDPSLNDRNRDRFRDTLLSEVMPQIEKAYHVSNSRNDRAIAGLSMGGGEALFTGLTTLDRFAWIGGFSSALIGQDFNAAFPSLDGKTNARIKLLWVSCGTEDRLIDSNRKFGEWLTSKGVKYAKIETPGAHTWMVWRRNLAAFAPLLFQ